MSPHSSSAASPGPPKEPFAISPQFLRLADVSPNIVWFATPGGRVTYLNKRWFDLTGQSSEEALSGAWLQAIHPEDSAGVADHWRRALADNASYEVEARYRGADGQYVWHLARAEPVRENGEIVGWFGTATDIQGRREAEERLRVESEALDILNRTGAAIAAELDLEKLVQTVTDAGTALTGAQFGAFFYNLIDQAGESYTLYTISGVPREKFSQFPMPRNTQIFNPTFKGEAIVRSADITKDPRYGKNDPHFGMPKGHLPVRSYLAVPVISRSGEVLGGLFFGHAAAGVFTGLSERVMVGIAAQAAIGIDNARLYRAAQREIAIRKQAEEERNLLLRELNHRVKNLFAIVSGMVTLTARSAPSVKTMAETLRGRINALARAHELIRSALSSEEPHEHMETASLRALLDAVLAPHLGGDEAGRLTIAGPEVSLGVSAATGLALVLHELATNAAKYGALSETDGELRIAWTRSESEFELTWRERGLRRDSGAAPVVGFGTTLARSTVEGQLGGSIDHRWNAERLDIAIRIPLSRLAR